MKKNSLGGNSRNTILRAARNLFAQYGLPGASMRAIAKKSGIAQSVIYYYFKDRNALLKAMFDEINTKLGKDRSELPAPKSASDMLRGRIAFQIDHAEEITAVLKYFFAFRKKFPKIKTGFIPDKAYLHIQEVLEYGVEKNEFFSKDIQKDSKIITHAINGFVLEYFPGVLRPIERKILINDIHRFLLRALENKPKPPSNRYYSPTKKVVKKNK